MIVIEKKEKKKEFIIIAFSCVITNIDITHLNPFSPIPHFRSHANLLLFLVHSLVQWAFWAQLTPNTQFIQILHYRYGFLKITYGFRSWEAVYWRDLVGDGRGEAEGLLSRLRRSAADCGDER